MRAEKSVLRVRTSRRYYVPIYAMSIFIVGFILWINLGEGSVSQVALLAAAIFIISSIKGSELHRFNFLYEITPLAVVFTEGIFSKRSKRIDLSSISDINISQNPWQRLLRYGDVDVKLFAEGSKIPNINNPKKFALVLEETMVNKGKNYNDTETP